MQRHSRYPAVFGILVVALWANSSYLAMGARVSFWYVTNVLVHLALGGLCLWAGLGSWRRFFASTDESERPIARWVAGSGLVTAASGIVLVVLGGGSSSYSRAALGAHALVAVAASCGLVALWKFPLTRFLLVLALLTPVATRFVPTTTATGDLNVALAPASMEYEAMAGESGPFYPSAAETNDGKLIPPEFFKGSDECGRCHTDIYQQWDSSAHHRASFNNQWYRKSIEYMQSVVGVTPSKWCAGCHDHALLFSGMMDRPVDEIVDTEEAHTGLACTSCHAITRVKNTSGNAAFTIEYPRLHDLATSDNPLVQAIHDFILHVDPEPHRKAFLKPIHTGDSAAFCSTCHKVHLDEPVNNYRWLRGFNSYDNWQASGVSGEGARSFYYPETPSTCTDCHMPRVPGDDPASVDGLIQSHRFAAANTALPTAYGDTEQLEAVEDFLKAGQVSVDLFALVRSEGDDVELQLNDQPRRLASTFAVGEEAEMSLPGRVIASNTDETTLGPLDRIRPSLVRGESVRLDAVVRTRKVGHFFPGGTVDAFDCWLELKATDETGRVFFWSGALEAPDGPVERGAHFYRSFMLDARGNHINKRNAWASRSTLYVQLIAPGAANTVRFRLRIPDEVGDKVTLEAKLNYRKFAWWHTQWAYAGVREPEAPAASADYDDSDWLMEGDLSQVSGPMKAIPNVPIVTMATARVDLDVVDRLDPESSVGGSIDPRDTERWNDYGIGLFTQGDLRGAERAFETVGELEPDYADGWVNQARVHLQEGDPNAAQSALEKALSIAPDLAKAHYFYGLSWKALGEYEIALEHFSRAAARYPQDRVVRNQIGRIHFLKREYRRAVDSFNRTLRIDPEDLEAHYNLMLAYRGLGNRELSETHRARYLRFKADEGSQEITGEFRLANPEDNNERLPIHEHGSAALR